MKNDFYTSARSIVDFQVLTLEVSLIPRYLFSLPTVNLKGTRLPIHVFSFFRIFSLHHLSV